MSGSISMSQVALTIPLSRTDSGLCVYYLSAWLNLAQFPVDHLFPSIMSILVFLLWLFDAFTSSSSSSSLWVFHSGVSWWFSTGGWVTASLLKSPGLSLKSFCVSFSRTYFRFYIYYLFAWSKVIFLHNFQWITLPTQSRLVLYCFWANLLHSFFMWLIVSSLSSHNLHLLFCCVWSILALIWLVLMALFYTAIRIDSVSLFQFSFLSHVHIFSCQTSLVSRLKRP